MRENPTRNQSQNGTHSLLCDTIEIIQCTVVEEYVSDGVKCVQKMVSMKVL